MPAKMAVTTSAAGSGPREVPLAAHTPPQAVASTQSTAVTGKAHFSGSVPFTSSSANSKSPSR